jgi:hypothetical protein
MSFLGALATSISEGIEAGRIEAQKKAAAKAEFMERYNEQLAAMDTLVTEGVRKGYLTKKSVAYHFAPELKTQSTTLSSTLIENQGLKDELRRNVRSNSINQSSYAKFNGLRFKMMSEADDFMSGLGYTTDSWSLYTRLYVNKTTGKTAFVQDDHSKNPAGDYVLTID